MRVQDLRRLGHEVDAALDDDVGIHLAGFDRQLQRIAADVGDAMENFRRLIIVRQDHGAARLFQFIDCLDVGRHEGPLDRRDHASDPLIEVCG